MDKVRVTHSSVVLLSCIRWSAVLLLAACSLPAQAYTASDIRAWVQEAVAYQLSELHHQGWSLRYRVHRTDGKEDTLRDLIETTEGNVARTLARNGQSLTPEQDATEQERLRALPLSEKRHLHSAAAMDTYATELIRTMPSAMTFTLASNQTQLPQLSLRQTVLDYKPDPAFHPTNTVEALLSGLSGQVWLDTETHHVLRMEIHIIKDLNLAFGLLARVYRGGTVQFEQQPVGAGHSAYRHIEIHVTLRELMVRTVPYHSKLDYSEAVVLASQPSLAEAVAMLLHPTANTH